MKRRTALRQIAYATGFVVATPTVLSLLNSCTASEKQWLPKILSSQESKLLNKLVDVYLPKTEQLPSAIELNVPQFIDSYVDKIYNPNDQKYFKSAFATMQEQLKVHADLQVNQIQEKHIEKFLDQYLKLKGEVDQERLENPGFEGLTTSEILNTLKSLSIKAYLTTEKIGEEVLAYDPIPGAYYCGDLNELTDGRSWSLS